MSAVEEEKIIKQYQPLIRALIPYEQQNRLLEGINKFSDRLPSSIRRIVKDEVVRLTSLTDAPADNSAFAQFPVMKFKHFGVQMRLDKVGAKILKDETALYHNRYTVGVFESVMNSDYYQAQLKKEQFKKIVDAFNVESQSFSDIDFGDDVAVCPNFTVSGIEFEKGRSCGISALGFTSMSVETRRPPGISNGQSIAFTFPEVKGLTQQPTEITYELSSVKYNKHTGKYESHFILDPEVDPKIADALKRYVRTSIYHQPLQRDLEIERAMQDLERDRLFENSPWLPVYCQSTRGVLVPVIALLTKSSAQYNRIDEILRVLGSSRNFEQLSEELQQFGEAFILSGSINTKKGAVDIITTHRQLAKSDVLAPYIYLLNKSGSLTVTHCRLVALAEIDKRKAFAIHDASAKSLPEMESLSHIVFCRDITSQLSHLTLSERCECKGIPKQWIADTDVRPIDYVMEEELDRRCETRYLVDKAATVKLGILSSLEARLCDFSSRGMKLKIAPGDYKIGEKVKVSVPDFKIKNGVYSLVSIDNDAGIIRLCVKDEVKQKRNGAAVSAIVESNPAQYKMRDIARKQKVIHRFLWELAIRNLPSLAVLCVINRHWRDRMKTVYQSATSDDLYPFCKTQNITPLHGFFADKNAAKPKSKLLEGLFAGKKHYALIVHCLRKKDDKLVYISEQDYLYTAIRQQIKGKLNDELIQLCASDVTAIRCHNSETPLTKKRLAQLSRIDKAIYDKLVAMQDGYTHCIYITNISALQNDVVKACLRGQRKKSISAAG